MKVLVYPHDLGMGGSQTNAIEIAGAMRALGVEPIVFGLPGTLCRRIEELGLEFVASPPPGPRPSPRIAVELRRLARARAVEVLHGYEWPPALECAAAAAGAPHRRAVSTVMSMAVPPFLPTSVPLVVGTEQIRADALARGRSRTHLLEPPVDLDHNVPSTLSEQDEFRQRWRLDPGRPLLVCVTRLAEELKSEGVLSAIRAVAGPLAPLDVQLLVVGDGPARDRVARAADLANAARPGRVVLTGELLDPRTAYSVADVALGMGGSALRSLAFGKPLVVQGEQGFFKLLEPGSLSIFTWQGWFGVGKDGLDGAAELAGIVARLLRDPVRAESLGRYGQQVVRERFSLQAAAATQLAVYERALAEPVPLHEVVRDAASSSGRLLAYHLRRRAARRTGTAAADDFNATPLAGRGPVRAGSPVEVGAP